MAEVDVDGADGVCAPPGHRHGAGVQRREDLLHGPAAAPVSGQLLRHHGRPNQKGAAPPCVCLLYCGVFIQQAVDLEPCVVVPPSDPPQGYDRVYMDIADINIDVPRAYFILEQFVEQSFIIGIIDVKLRDDCPCR